MNYFTFDGIDSRDYNTYIATSNAFDAPGREDEVIKVPGSNNIYYLTEGTYKPFDIKLYCYIPSNMQVKTDDLRNFLLSKGTCTYTEAIRPGEFRVARFIEAYEIDVSDRVSAAFVLTFKAQPQRYLTTNTPITTTATADTTTDTTMSLSTVPTPINISLNGNTTQEGSSGKNLLGLTNGTYTHNGITAVVSDGLVTYSGSTNSTDQALIDIPIDIISSSLGTLTKGLQPTGTYTGLQTSLRGSNPNTSAGLWSNNGSNNTGTLSENAYYFRIQVGVSITVNGKILPQIEQGSTATSYEPHISPTNPQVIHSVSGDNTVNVTSKNIFDYEEVTNKGVIDDNGTVSTYNIRLFSGKIAVLPNTTYTFKTSAYSQNNERIYINRFIYYGKDGSFLRRDATYNTLSEATFTIPSDVYFLVIDLRTQALTTALNNSLLDGNTQLEKGTSRTDFEPYTRQSYPLYLPAKNYFDLNTVYADTTYYTIDGDSVTSNYFSVAKCYIPSRLVGKKCTFQAYIYSNPTTVNMRVRANVNGTSTDGNYIRYGEEGISSVSFTPTSTSDYVHVTYSDVGGYVTIKNLMLSEGNLNNHYNRYGNPSIELNKIGTYQDYIYKNGGKWYVHKETGKVDLGTLTWLKRTYSGAPHPDYFSCTEASFIKSPVNTTTPADMRCPIYTSVGASVSMALASNYLMNVYNGTLSIVNDTYTDARTFKTAMNGVPLIYVSRASTNTEITDTTLINQLNSIEKAYSYNGTTNILQVSNDNGFMLEVVSLHSNDVNSDYKGEPIITVNSTGLIYFNGCVIKVNQAPMTINSQTMQAYNGVINLNNYIEANDFPMIEAGTNVIGSEMPLSIVPNYWKL